MVLTTALLFGLGGWAAEASPTPAGAHTLTADPLVDVVEERATCLPPPLPRARSKKEMWRLEKATRPDVHLGGLELSRLSQATRKKALRPVLTLPSEPPAPGSRVEPVTTLFNTWTREAVPLLPGFITLDRLSTDRRFHLFLRDHFTNQATSMDLRLYDVLARAARRFGADRIEVVSGYRSPKYNLMLRKKGRQVARSSQHTEGNAVDFRIRGVPTKSLLLFVRSLRLGGVGFYPNSQFVHSDTGPVRFWKGS